MSQPSLRHEHKYLISTGCAELLRYRLKAAMRTDRHAPEGGYLVRSLYFDDINYTAYNDKLAGIADRSKLRLRYYNFDESYIVFEKKEKAGSLTKKTSVKVSRELAIAMANGDKTPVETSNIPLVQEFAVLCKTGLLHPVVIVDYDRIPFVCPVSDVRITLDLKLRTPSRGLCPFDKDIPTIPVLGREEAILEVKFNEFLPPYLADLLRDIPKAQMAISKYCKCLEITGERISSHEQLCRHNKKQIS